MRIKESGVLSPEKQSFMFRFRNSDSKISGYAETLRRPYSTQRPAVLLTCSTHGSHLSKQHYPPGQLHAINADGALFRHDP